LLFFADGTSAYAVNRTVVGITNGTTLYYDVNRESPVERYLLTFTGLGAGDRLSVTSIVFHRNNTIGITEVKEVTTLMNAVAVAPATTVYSTAVDCVNIKRTALTVRETWGAGGLIGATVELQSSYDGTNWDTEAWIDGLETTPFTVAPPYPATQQVTHNIDPIPRYYRVAVTNNDPSPVTVTVITTEVE
jgi:hypothetical protein